MHYNTNTKNIKIHTTQKIFNQLNRTELELTKDISKLIQKEKMIKDISYMNEMNGNPNNIILERNKMKLELKKILEIKKIKLSRLNEIK